MPTPTILSTEQRAEVAQATPNVNVSKIIPGTEKLKDPFTEGQKKQAGFAIRMENAIKRFNEIEDSGFNPVNLKDVMIDNAPFIPGGLERFLTSAKYKQYQRALIDFATAQLRQETGAVINNTEIDWMYLTYFPQLGDDPQTLLDKRQARQDAYIGMRSQAGKAYDRVKQETIKYGEELGVEGTGYEALQILRKRAKTDPELARKLEEKGLL
tara:strand:+ start:360 stop:995 length:636 start_codon:yes stop_codon:yes gene_type:complete